MFEDFLEELEVKSVAYEVVRKHDADCLYVLVFQSHETSDYLAELSNRDHFKLLLLVSCFLYRLVVQEVFKHVLQRYPILLKVVGYHKDSFLSMLFVLSGPEVIVLIIVPLQIFCLDVGIDYRWRFHVMICILCHYLHDAKSLLRSRWFKLLLSRLFHLLLELNCSLSLDRLLLFGKLFLQVLNLILNLVNLFLLFLNALLGTVQSLS